MLNKIKKLRVEIKKALEKAGGDEQKAVEILRVSGQAKALKKADRQVANGAIAAYIHSNNRVGAMIQLNCETDFVARNKEFLELARDVAMHIAAMNPQFVKPEEVDEEIIAKEKKIWESQLLEEKKPENIKEKILSGKEKKFREEISLLSQPFVKNPEITVGELIAEKIAKTGENIQVKKFIRYEL